MDAGSSDRGSILRSLVAGPKMPAATLSLHAYTKGLPTVVPLVHHTLSSHDQRPERLQAAIADVLQDLDASSSEPATAIICISASSGVITAVGQAGGAVADTASMADASCAKLSGPDSMAPGPSSTGLLAALQPHMLLPLQRITAAELQLPGCSRR